MARRKKSGAAGASAATDHANRNSRKRSKPAFSVYVYKVLKQVHPELSMTNKAMKVMDDFMHDIYTRLVEEASNLVKFSRKSTLSASEFQTATRLILPGELAKHAVSDATKAVANFMRSKMNDAADANVSQGKQSRVGASGRPELSKGPIEIEILRPAPGSSDRIEDVDHVEPVIKPTEQMNVNAESPSRKRKSAEEVEFETMEPIASTSTPRKSPPKRQVPPDRRSALEALEALETPHKEDLKPDESEDEGPIDEEPAPPTPPTEEESDESYQSLPEAEASARDVEERDVSNPQEANFSVNVLQDIDAEDAAPTTSAATASSGKPSRIDEGARSTHTVPVLQLQDSSAEISLVLLEKPSEKEPTPSRSLENIQKPVDKAGKAPKNEKISSSEDIGSDKATQGTETDNETVVMDTETSLESEDPLFSVRVQVNRGGRPEIRSNISIFERTVEGANQNPISGCMEADTSTAENDANLNNSLAESQPSVLSDESGLATSYTRIYSANCASSEAATKTVETVKCSKVTTTRTVITHERREQISEWVTESEK